MRHSETQSPIISCSALQELPELPIDELDCYRRASVWGMEDREIKHDQTLELALFKHIKPPCSKHFLLASVLQDIPINFVREWFFEDVDKVGLESPLGLLGLLGWLLTPRSCRGYGATSLTSIPMAKGCSHWQSRSDAECRDRSKGSLWTQQVLLQIVSFAFGIAWQRETFPFESYQKTKLSQNGRMEDRMLWAFIRIRSF